MSDFNISEDAQGAFSGSQSSNNDDVDSSQPIESAFPDEDEDTITMLDVIEREDKLEEEASAVLGNSDEKNCTYPRGYIPRQALYSCATCSDGPDKMGAICLACSLECHDNHEVYELYTKRNYRCDCGNSKFKQGFECKLMEGQEKKSPYNEKNKYNHNFHGRYCICDKRYPPDENDNSAESQDDMLQCIACEDWYHSKHLGAKEIPNKYAEMICGGCVEKHDFVRYYEGLDLGEDIQDSQDTSSESRPKIDATGSKTTKSNEIDSKVSQEKTKDDNSLVESSISAELDKMVKCDNSNAVCESDTNDSQAENKDPGCTSPNEQKIKVECLLGKLRSEAEKMEISDKSETETKKRPVFFSDCSWRSKLCRCPDCMDMYKSKDCEYLLDEQDTIQYYEAQGKAISKDTASPFERGMTALNHMNRAAVVEALHGYDELKADLSDYLKKFADSKKVVREEDIREFFEQLKSKKRPRLEYS